MSTITLNAEARTDKGKGASRRLRRIAEKIPAIVYGGNKPPQSLTLMHKDIIKATEDEAFFSQLINLNIDGKNSEELVVLKDLQRHPAKAIIMHADFLRVSDDKPISQRIPLHFINEANCYGVKMQGGRISHSMKLLEVTCLPSKLPKYIEVDMQDIKSGQIVHISDIELPEGVTATALQQGADHDLPAVSVIAPKGGQAADGESAGDADGDS